MLALEEGIEASDNPFIAHACKEEREKGAVAREREEKGKALTIVYVAHPLPSYLY